jgi:hypothetical protein
MTNIACFCSYAEYRPKIIIITIRMGHQCNTGTVWEGESVGGGKGNEEASGG